MLKKFKCWLLGHTLYHVQELSEQSERVKCDDCGKEFAINHAMNGLAIPFNRETRKFYEDVFNVRILK